MLSMKHAASRPRPPLPSAASGSSSRSCSRSIPSSASACAGGFQQAEAVQVVDQQAPDEEFQGQVIHPLLLASVDLLHRVFPVVDQVIAGRQGHGFEPVVRAGGVRDPCRPRSCSLARMLSRNAATRSASGRSDWDMAGPRRRLRMKHEAPCGLPEFPAGRRTPRHSHRSTCRDRHREVPVMPRGSKAKYTDKQKRKAEHIEESYRDQGISEAEAEARAWATVNRQSGGGERAGGSGAEESAGRQSQGPSAIGPPRRGHQARRAALRIGEPGSAEQAGAAATGAHPEHSRPLDDGQTGADRGVAQGVLKYPAGLEASAPACAFQALPARSSPSVWKRASSSPGAEWAASADSRINV